MCIIVCYNYSIGLYHSMLYSSNVREAWVPEGKLPAGPIATLLTQDDSVFPWEPSRTLPGSFESMSDLFPGYMCMYIYIYIYVYIQRERER